MRSTFFLASVAALCFVQFWMGSKLAKDLYDSSRDNQNQVALTPKAQADGCYHVFLDVGSNIGNHVRFLYEPQLYRVYGI